MEYEWYPGHMAHARRLIEEDIKLVDLIIEILDARIPISSRNPDIGKLGRGKARYFLLAKADLADPSMNEEWIRFFRSKGMPALAADLRDNSLKTRLVKEFHAECADILKKNKEKGMTARPIRALVAGIPNAGKSTLINSCSGRTVSKTGNRPGVTKGKQWIRLSGEMEFLDTPGLLWPNRTDKMAGIRLAMTGAMNDEIFDRADLAMKIMADVTALKPEAFTERYGLAPDLPENPEEEDAETPSGVRLLERIAVKRGALRKGGIPDIEKAASFVIDDFRKGYLGRITLEAPDDERNKFF